MKTKLPTTHWELQYEEYWELVGGTKHKTFLYLNRIKSSSFPSPPLHPSKGKKTELVLFILVHLIGCLENIS
jgi:hypothetical protein